MASGKFIAYYRVSTQKQGQSGLGLEAQQAAVRRHLDGGRWELVAEMTEIESGKNADRPVLHRALALCRAYSATLIIAKLDRLARNVAFIANLMEAGVDFVAVDMPSANRFVLHIMAAMAEEEASAISKRTKAALAQARERGVKLGGMRRGADHMRAIAKAGNLASIRVRRAKAEARRAVDRIRVEHEKRVV